MTYSATIDYLYSRLPMFTRIGAAAYKKDLHNTIALLEALGNPHQHFKSIHIAGTNGKGSTSHMLAAIFHEAGYKTGLYTSPHLYDFRERIKTSDEHQLEMISQDFVIEFTASIKHLIESLEPSFFEVTVAMAFAWFAHQQIDIAIVETGLGGRLDSTNVITPELSIITNIGWDHMNLLGNTLEAIAAEKAGIIKPGIPVVIGETLEETLSVFLARIDAVNAPATFAEKAWMITDTVPGIEHLGISLHHSITGQALTLQCDLPGLYQQYNVRTVITAIDQMRKRDWKITDKNIEEAFKQVKTLTGLGGRWQVIGKKPFVVLDVAHNEAGMQQLLNQINAIQKEMGFPRIHMVIGMVKDKEIDKVLELLPAAYQYYFTQAQLPRALPYAELKEKAGYFHLSGDGFPTPDTALNAALQIAKENDLVIVCGSVFVVAEINTGRFASA